MTPAEPELTPVAVAVAALTVLLGPQLAAVIGAYAVILLGWLGGVMVGVYRMPPAGRGQLFAFVVVSLVAVIGVTVPLAEAGAQALRAMVPWMSATEAKGLLFPVAFLLPAVGHSWADVGGWAWDAIRSRFGARDNKEGRQP
jgi:hypothetical protein